MARKTMVGAIVVSLCILLASCGGGGESTVGKSTEQRFIKLTQEFGTLILADDWAGAHAMFSRSLASSTSAEQLAQIVNANEAEYHEHFAPMGVEGYLNAWGDEIDADTYDVPPSVPNTPEWTAYTLAAIVLEREDDGEVGRCYNIGLLWVNEEGQDRIAHFEYFWCD